MPAAVYKPGTGTVPTRGLEQTVSVTKLLYLSNSGPPDWSVFCVSWLGFNYIRLTASSDAADVIKDAFGMRVNCLWTVTAWSVFISCSQTELQRLTNHDVVFQTPHQQQCIRCNQT